MAHEPLKDYLTKNSLPILLQVLSVASLILALYITTRLAPLAQDLAVISQRVEANERLDQNQHPAFVTHEEIEREITTRLDRIESKVDALIGKYIK
jgi:hypothetical protein